MICNMVTAGPMNGTQWAGGMLWEKQSTERVHGFTVFG